MALEENRSFDISPMPPRGLWTVAAVAAAPAMVGSLLLMLVLLAGLGRWEGLLLLGWLGSGALVLKPIG